MSTIANVLTNAFYIKTVKYINSTVIKNTLLIDKYIPLDPNYLQKFHTGFVNREILLSNTLPS